MKTRNLCLVAAVMALSMVTGLLTPSGTAYADELPTVPHYKCYEILEQQAPQVSPVYIQTQFGIEENVAVGPPTRLCLAAVKNGEGSLSVPDVECYQITPPQPSLIPNLNLQTQFGTQTNVAVGGPKELCVPALKAVYPDPPQGSLESVPHYKCYEISGQQAPQVSHVYIQTLFGTEEDVTVGPPTRLCLAAVKNGEGSLSVPDVECFSISGPAGAIPPLNLQTQFGPQGNVLIASPRELCVPALKEVVPPTPTPTPTPPPTPTPTPTPTRTPTPRTGIGGIAEAPDADASTLGATASGGSSGTTYAVIAGIAAGAVLLAAGGWYARRRRRAG